MDFKKFWSQSIVGFILKRLLLATAILVVISWIVLYLTDIYTEHGHTEKVPDLSGMYMEEVEVMLRNHSLNAQVIDSVYVKNKKLGTVVQQSPAPGSSIKRNRPVYIIINSRQVKTTPLPEINDISYRQADAMLRSIGINVSNVEYAPSEYKELVIDVKYGGRSIAAGYRLPEGSYVTLVVGSGIGDEDIVVPDLKGITLDEAKAAVLESKAVIGAIDFDYTPHGNEDAYVLYRQRPAAGKLVPAGTRIDIWLSKDKEMLNKTFEDDETTKEDEAFF